MRHSHRLIVHPRLPGEQRFDIKQGVMTLGRSSENEVFVLHKSLSRQHARLEVEGERVVLVDLNSRNGTFIQGVRIARQELHPGDTFMCGEVSFQLLSGRMSEDVLPPVTPTLVYAVEPHGAMTDLLEASTHDSTSALKVKHLDDHERARHKLQILLEVSQILSSPGTLDEVLHRVLQLVFDILDVDRTAILLVEEESQRLLPRVVRSASGSVDPRHVYSAQIVNYVRTHGVAALFSNTLEDPRLDLQTSSSILSQSICAAMCVPIKSKEKLLGVLYLDNLRVPNRFTEEDLMFTASYANQAAVAIDNSMLYQRLEREAVLRSTYQRFFPPSTLRRLELTRQATLEAVETEVTALFADIGDFTRMSSRLRPIQVVALLNEYFPVMADVVFRHQGTLEKYIGDALMAVWGAPFSTLDDADLALSAAVEMQQRMKELNQRWRSRGEAEIHIHIGLNTGSVAAGNIGSEHYLQYATIGDATNIASRICGLAGAGQILLGESTHERLKSSRWPITRLESVRVKGKDEALALYRVHWDQVEEEHD